MEWRSKPSFSFSVFFISFPPSRRQGCMNGPFLARFVLKKDICEKTKKEHWQKIRIMT
jgi:hypothetical protein